VEIMIAIMLLSMALIPVFSMFSTSGRMVTKSQNLGLAVSFAHRISQHLLAMPYDSIVDVPIPGNSIAGGPDDEIFNPVANWGTTKTSRVPINPNQMPGLFHFLRKFEFRYALLVSPMVFGPGDELKSVCVFISWREQGVDFSYRTYVYVAKM
jgi:hypothetical protein